MIKKKKQTNNMAINFRQNKPRLHCTYFSFLQFFFFLRGTLLYFLLMIRLLNSNRASNFHDSFLKSMIIMGERRFEQCFYTQALIFMIKFQYVWHFKTMWVIKYWLKCNTHPQIFTEIYSCPSNFSSFQFNHLSFKTVQLRPLLVLH